MNEDVSYTKINRQYSTSRIIYFITFLGNMEEKTFADLPNEIIEMVMPYLSLEELFDVAEVGMERLKKCSFRALRKKSCGKYHFTVMLNLLFLYDSLDVIISFLLYFLFQTCQNF